jgi:hypothetical protein
MIKSKAIQTLSKRAKEQKYKIKSRRTELKIIIYTNYKPMVKLKTNKTLTKRKMKKKYINQN